MSSARVETIEPIALAERIRQGDDALILIDVREADERAFCRISTETSITDGHFPMSSIVDRLDELVQTTSDKIVVFYCHHGIRSRRVAAWFLAGGNQGDRVPASRAVFNLEGGIDRWTTEVDPAIPRY